MRWVHKIRTTIRTTERDRGTLNRRLHVRRKFQTSRSVKHYEKIKSVFETNNAAVRISRTLRAYLVIGNALRV